MTGPGDRGDAMARSLGRTARSSGLDGPATSLVETAFELAMEPRRAGLDDDHHPAFLHPGRTVLVLLRDAAVRDPVALAAGALLETRDAPFRVPTERVEEALGPAVAGLLRAAPRPGAEGLAEALVTAGEGLRLASLAEHLDHLRHLHVREPASDWRDLLVEVERVWLPVAERSGSTLARRYRHWAKVFRKRLALVTPSPAREPRDQSTGHRDLP